MKHIVGFSGGIDSQEAAARVIALYGTDDTILLNSNAGGNEDPLTELFIDEYSATVHPVIKVTAIIADLWKTEGFAETKGLDGSAPLSFLGMIQIKKRPPSRKAQFCTAALKLAPQKRWMEENLKDDDYERYTGVRRDESEARKNYPDREWDDYFDCYVTHIIAGLTKQECFDGAKSRGEAINPLYLMGFGRVGCAPCINSGKEDILNWLLRRPAMIDKTSRLGALNGFFVFSAHGPRLTDQFHRSGYRVGADCPRWSAKHVSDHARARGLRKQVRVMRMMPKSVPPRTPERTRHEQHGQPTHGIREGVKMLFAAHFDRDPLRIHYAKENLSFLVDIERLTSYQRKHR